MGSFEAWQMGSHHHQHSLAGSASQDTPTLIYLKNSLVVALKVDTFYVKNVYLQFNLVHAFSFVLGIYFQ